MDSALELSDKVTRDFFIKFANIERRGIFVFVFVLVNVVSQLACAVTRQPWHFESWQNRLPIQVVNTTDVAKLSVSVATPALPIRMFINENKCREDGRDLRLVESYLTKKQNIVWLGPTGCGKTGLATSFLLQALDRGYRGYFS